MTESYEHQEVFNAFFGEFRGLRPVQEKSIPILLGGENIVVSAGTGTGKTDAVIAPLVARYIDYALSNDCLTWLYITPTKALVNDIYRRAEPVLSRLHINAGIRHGDRDDTLRSAPTNFLITTPESLDVLLCRHDRTLQSVRAVIVDEAHILYNTQRGLQTALLISRLGSEITNPPLQIAYLSATISSCEDIVTFLFGSSASFNKVVMPSKRSIDAAIRLVRSEQDFVGLVDSIMQGGPAKLLVFANSRKQCDRLSALLLQNEQLSDIIFTHYSSLSTQMREDTERAFNESQNAVCIATSTLELGIDVGDIDGVILYGAPPTVSSFLQRIGRGNRRSNKTNAICLIPDESKKPVFDALVFHAIVELAREGAIEKARPMQLFGAMAQQALSVIAANGGAYTRVKDISAIASGHRHLTEQVIDEILSEASAQGFTQPHGFKHSYGADEKLYSLIDHRMIYGNMPMRFQEVVLSQGKKEIGRIPASNLLRIRTGNVIRFAGRYWRVIRADQDGIKVEPSQRVEYAMDVRFATGGTEVMDLLILNRVYEYLTGRPVDAALFGKAIVEQVTRTLEGACKVFTNDSVPVVHSTDRFYHITFAGDLFNRVLSISLGIAETRADDIGFWAPEIMDLSGISPDLAAYESVVAGLFAPSSSQTLFQSLLPEHLQRREFVEQWLCDPENEKVMNRLKKSTPKEITQGSVAWLIDHR